MKRYGNLFEQAFTRENLYAAYKTAAQGKHGKRSCYEFEKRLAYNLDRLYTSIHDGTYRPKPHFCFTVYEPKQRTIFAPAFADLVVQHAIYSVILPIFDRTMIDQSFACRPGKGTHKAADYAQEALKKSRPGSYSLKLDIRKFFYRIQRTILRTLLERKIKDKRLVELMMLFTDHGEAVGIPIGSLLSQIFALIYMNPLDHFIKRVLKVRLYCRYVDDFILFNLTRREAIHFRARIVLFISKHLQLELSKSTIAKTERGVNFVGYRTWKTRRFIRRHSLFKFRRAARKGKLASAASILGHAKRTHSLKFLLDKLRNQYHDLYRQLPKAYRRIHHLPARAAG